MYRVGGARDGGISVTFCLTQMLFMSRDFTYQNYRQVQELSLSNEIWLRPTKNSKVLVSFNHISRRHLYVNNACTN